jgi:choline dehydrogenase
MNARTLNERARGARLLWEIGAWLATGTGLLSFSPAHVGAFIRSREELDEPDLQVVFTPASYSEGVTGALQTFPGMTCGVWQMRPHSRGWVRARSPDPEGAPAIQPAYLAEEADRRAAVDGLRWMRRLLGAPALASIAGRRRCPAPR